MHNDPERLRRLFEGSGGEFDGAQLRRTVRRTLKVVLTLAIVIFALAGVRPYVEWLWYAHDVRQPAVFTTAYGARSTLFLFSFLAAWAFLYLNLRQALTASLVYLQRPDTTGQRLVSNALGFIQQVGGTAVRLGAPVFAFFSALTFSNEAQTYLLARHAERFGTNDPTFGLDLGFFVFTLPWYRAISNYAFSLLLLTTALSIGIYIGLQAMAALARVELSRPHFRFHVSLLIGLTMLGFGAQTWLKTYEAGLIESGQFTGAGYAAMQQVGASRIFAVLLLVAGLSTIVFAKKGRPYAVPLASGIGLAAFFLIGLVAYHAAVQRLVVDPDRLGRERPFADRAIRMSRLAWGIDKIETRDFPVQASPTAAEVQAAQPTLQNMRLWDPEVLRQSLEGLQATKPYYAFHDVDIDRYVVNGQPTMVMVSPRDVQLDGLDPSARNWANERLRYTHGYGVTVSPVNTAAPDGSPSFLAQGIPQQAVPAFAVKEPRIYFSDQRTAARVPTDEYALVNTGQPEFDFPTAGGEATHRWLGGRGIPVSGFFARLALSFALGDGNLLVSGNVRPETRLLMRRNVSQRVAKVLPFVRIDDDPYLVVADGRLVWIVDAYTWTDSMPYSASIRVQDGRLNYMRNSVKATVDAYSGEVRAYAMEPDEPILRAYRRIYPGLVRDLGEMAPSLRAHLRYPEDLFALQCYVLAPYHVTDPTVFLTNSDAWEIATERNLAGQPAPITPYYVLMRLPDEPRPGFVQILPFSPRARQTRAGWIAAHCDPDRYGKLTLYRFPQGSSLPGPGLIESNFTSTAEISNINRQFNNEQSEIRVGNLLVIPIGRSVMYAESLFLQSRTAGIQPVPRLFRVILALQDKVVVGETYQDALRRLFENSGNVADAPTAPGEPRPDIRQPTQAEAREALRLFEQADAALRQGDFARYGELQKQLKQRLTKLAQ